MVTICEQGRLKRVRVFKKIREPKDPETTGIFVLIVANTLMPNTESSANHQDHDFRVSQTTKSQAAMSYQVASFDIEYLRFEEAIQFLMDIVIGNSMLFSSETVATLGRDMAAYILTRFKFDFSNINTNAMVMFLVELERTVTVSYDNDGRLDFPMINNVVQGHYHIGWHDNVEGIDGITRVELDEEEDKDGDGDDNDYGIFEHVQYFLDHQDSMGAPQEFDHEVESAMEIQEFNGGDDASVEDCPICLGGISAGMEVAQTACHHIFHKTCMFAWLLKENKSCPMCRSTCVALV